MGHIISLFIKVTVKDILLPTRTILIVNIKQMFSGTLLQDIFSSSEN